MAQPQKIKQDLRLIEALRFMNESGLSFEMRGETLMVSPASKARREAERIRDLRSQIVELLETEHYSESLASALFIQAALHVTAMMGGKLVEVYNHAEFEQPDLWQVYEATGKAIDAAGRARDMDAYRESILQHVAAHKAMLDAYNENKKVAA